MIIALILQIAAAAPDSARLVSVPGPAITVDRQQDTTRRPRRKAIEVSEAYGERLTLHRWASYAMVPVFAAQYVSGTKLFDAQANNTRAPSWAKPVHSLSAMG